MLRQAGGITSTVCQNFAYDVSITLGGNRNVSPFVCSRFTAVSANATAYGNPRGTLSVYEAFADPINQDRLWDAYGLQCGDAL
eukprot:264924-Chlamydomonas_euryale.AAC.1